MCSLGMLLSVATQIHYKILYVTYRNKGALTGSVCFKHHLKHQEVLEHTIMMLDTDPRLTVVCNTTLPINLLNF